MRLSIPAVPHRSIPKITRHNFAGSANGLGILILSLSSLVMMLLVAGCTAAPGDTQARFALTSADVLVERGDVFPVNLLFTAPPNDVIWQGLQGVVLQAEGVEPGEYEYGPDAFVVEAGDQRSGTRLGNVSLSLPAPASALSFTSVELFFANQATPITVNVGSWNLQTLPAPAPVDMTGDYQITAPECGVSEATIVSQPGRAISVSSVYTESDGARVADWTADVSRTDADETNLRFELACDDTFDFYIVSPRLMLREDEVELKGALDAISIGLLDVTDDDVARISQR